ncbi:MAG: DUF2059 domain-containing protein [Pseudomonadota bacterium]
MRALLTALYLPLFLTFGAVHATAAADRDRLEAFLQVTGFDVALESIRLSAGSAPQMIGLEAEDFGLQWTRLVEDVFETDGMHDMALDILEETLEPDLLAHAAGFYASDLGQRLVVAENASHMVEDDDAKREAGGQIIAGLTQIGSPRLALIERLNAASGGADHAVEAIQEIQVRFLMTAAAAGVIELRMEEPDLRSALAENAGELRRSVEASALAGAAYTYQSFSDAEVEAYAEALEHEDMRAVYALMNSVQYEIMANRFEALALAMTGLQPTQEL